MMQRGNDPLGAYGRPHECRDVMQRLADAERRIGALEATCELLKRELENKANRRRRDTS